MELPELIITNEFTDYPEEFYRTDPHEPFRVCTFCGKNFDSKQRFLVEKAFRQYPGHKAKDVVFEYAICLECYQEYQTKLSDESSRRLEEYFSSKTDFVGRRKRLLEKKPWNVKDWLSECFVSGEKKEDMKEYQIIGEFYGDKLIFGYWPALISGDTVGEMAALLSNQTLDDFRDYFDTIYDPPDGLKKLLQDDKVPLFL